jgi:hypothetical protein
MRLSSTCETWWNRDFESLTAFLAVHGEFFALRNASIDDPFIRKYVVFHQLGYIKTILMSAIWAFNWSKRRHGAPPEKDGDSIYSTARLCKEFY